ncbi:BLUF domain-containing protein [Chitinilyticum litopenaei]|uniref:BLUF domain-containing protein n=1 Tax=Chitinilyticum litopenaei TaxID=1121276 RepID=UPI000426BC90|nr:BLUF domain-containing protein [Chitinilyticum litopenaei]
MLVRLIYASEATAAITPVVLDDILRNSRQYNQEHGITGVLCFSGTAFVQVLEGDRGAVSKLYNRIVKDGRHQRVELLEFSEISERHFAGWTMGQVNLAKINPAILLRYLPRAEFDPYSCSSQAILKLVQELIATAAVNK